MGRGFGLDMQGTYDMPYSIKRAEYYYTTIRDRPGAAYKLLAQMAEMGLNLVAFTAVPMGPMHTQLTIFPEDPTTMSAMAQRAGMRIEGPHPAFLVQGDDELGALAEIHSVLYQANVNVYASTGVTDGRGTFGYLIYVRADDFDRAAQALSL